MNQRPTIVVLDGHTLNPGDLSWHDLEALGDVTIHARTAPADIVTRSQDAPVVFTNKTPLTAETLAQLPALRYIGVLATGFNVVDVSAARARGIMVTNVPDYGTASVAQHVFALLLELTNHVGHHANTVRDGRWARSPDFCYWDGPLIELAGKHLGLIGAGRIGRAVGRLGEAFGMNVSFARRTDGATGLDRVLRESDVVSLHCPLTDATRHLINRETVARMKATALLINTGRGPLVDEAALAEALHAGNLRGAALDVMEREPPPAGHPLFSAPRCIITPHIAWATSAARARLLDVAVANLRAFLAGRAQNVVS